MRLHVLTATTAVIASIACSGSNTASAGGEAGGTVVITTAGEADFLLPAIAASATSKQVADQIYEKLAEIGPKLNVIGDEGFTPQLATRWRWAPDSLSITFELDPRARWHDGRPVRASDVRFTHRLYTSADVASRDAVYFANVDSVSIPDSLTAVLWFRERRPEQFAEVVYNMMIVPEHVLGAIKPADLRSAAPVREPVGSGPFRFVRWDAGSRIEIIADTSHYRGRPPLDRVIWSIAPDAQTTVTRLLAGEADFHENVPVAMHDQVRANPDLRLMQYPALQYIFLGFNLQAPRGSRPHPILGDRSLRRALSGGVDRAAMVRNVFDTLGRVGQGPFVSALMPDVKIEPIAFDLERAQRTLDSLGWRDSNADGIREKNGRPLEFGILVPTSSRPRMSLAVLLQEQFRRLGVKANIDAVEFTAFLDRVRNGRFDSWLGTWVTDASPGGIRQTWTSAGARGQDGQNFQKYMNPAFDVLVDSALASTSQERRRSYFQRAYQTIVEDAPAIWLAEPITVAGVHKRIRVEGIRPDAWWAGIDRWQIPQEQRIARDSIGLRQRVN